MGYQTPNIDRIAREGARFTDWYGQQSCTAGRAAFFTGQSPIRTGLTKVGLPGSTLGLQPHDPTIAELLEPLGYATGQFGKNHLGDRNQFLPTVVADCLTGHKAEEKTFKVHLDGYNLIPALKGETTEWPRKEMMYWSDDGDLMALRYTRWKVIFQEQRNEGFKIWTEPFVKLRAPTLIDLRADPFEKGPMGAIYYSDWQAHRMFAFVPAQAFVAKWISSFKEFPPRQSPASFSIDAVMQRLEEAPSKAMRRFLSLSRENGLPHTLDRQALEWFKGGIITNGRPQELLDALRPQQSTRICPFPSYGYPQSRRDQAAHGRAPGFHEISKGYFAASQRDAARPFIETFTRAWTRLCKLTKAG